MMEAATLIVPAIASIALGAALLVPIRDSRKGRRATVSGSAPLKLDFHRSPGESPVSTISALVNVLPADASAAGAGASLQAPEELAAIATIRTFVEKLRVKFFAPPERVDTSNQSDASELVVERSFAQELAELLPIESARALPVDATPSHETQAREDIESVIRVEEPTRVLPASSRADRIVPLTRLPLRHVPAAITWPATATPPLTFADDGARYAFLRSLARSRSVENDALLARAYRDETEAGRTLALAALSRTTASRASIETFTVALATGTDEERAIAVDALADAGAREELPRGLNDRVEAIAARAALAYVGSTAREDYRTALSAFLDEARIEAILAVLAGIVE